MIITLNSDLSINHKGQEFLGGKFNWVENLKLKGVGSVKFLYLSGINDFDEIKLQSQNLDYVNLEIFKNGLAIRFSKRNIHKALLIRYDVINSINIVSQRIRKIHRGKEIIVKKADLAINFENESLTLGLTPSNYTSGIEFFEKNPINSFCNHNLNPEIIEDNNFTDWMSWVNDIW